MFLGTDAAAHQDRRGADCAAAEDDETGAEFASSASRVDDPHPAHLVVSNDQRVDERAELEGEVRMVEDGAHVGCPRRESLSITEIELHPGDAVELAGVVVGVDRETPADGGVENRLLDGREVGFDHVEQTVVGAGGLDPLEQR